MKKNGCRGPLCASTSVIKCLLLMKMVVLLICLFSLQSIAHNGFGQERITLKLDNTPFRKVFKVIEKQTSFRFVYNEEIIPADQKISISVQQQPVDNVMRQLLANTPLTFKIVGSDLIVISTGTPPAGEAARPPAFEVSGKVMNEQNEPMVNVSIQEKGTSNGTTTKADGSFALEVASESAVLVVSSVGFVTQEIALNGRNSLTISMQPSLDDLNEVVVVGYGTQKRSDVTGSVASVPKSRLSQVPVTNVLHAIEGSVAGVNVTQSSSVPGRSADVLVRGQNSINAGTGPFIVVDGIPFSTTGGVTNDINMNDIESIEVLKDASAVAIYGTRGANGVILITTKRGASGKPVIRYNGYVGLDNIAHMLDPMSPEQYVQKYADFLKQRSLPQTSVLENQYEIANYNAGKTIDWIDEVTQQGILQDHNVSISGGSPDVKYYLSGEYLKQQGVVKGYQYQRASIRANLDFRITDYLSAGTTIFYTHNNYDGGRANFFLGAAMSPYGTLYKETGQYEIYPMYQELLYKNPLIGLYADRMDRSNNLNGNFFAELKPGFIKGLKYRLNAAYTYVPTSYGYYEGRSMDNQLGYATVSNTENKTYVIENILTYTKDWKKHHIDFTGLYSAQRTRYNSSSASATGFVNDELSYHNLGAGATQTSASYANESSLLSQMGRINYAYDSRYLLTVTARRDGASVFGANTSKYGVFPSFAVGWNISNEAFMQHVVAINNLKLRASYGKSGNQAISVNQTATVENAVRFPFNGASTIGVLAGSLGNANLNWESTLGLNLGVDFTILNRRISGTVDFYRTKTYDILLRRNIPIITGYSNVWDNLGETQNTGIEVTLNTRNVEAGDFRWESTINFASNKNKLVELYGDGKDDVGNRWFLGQPLGIIYDYKMIGVWQVGEDFSSDPGAKPGDLKFEDHDKSGTITAEDRMIQGQTRPKWIGGIINTFHYKNFHLNIFIQTTQGALKNNVTLTYADEGGRMNLPEAIGYWTEENQSNIRPALSYFNSRGYGYPSDNSFTRIKDVTLSYTMPATMLERIGLGSATIYLSGRNLYTFTDWIGWDPEQNYSFRGSGDWTNNYPIVRSLVLGANITLR